MYNISGLIEYNIVRSGTIYLFYESVATLTDKIVWKRLYLDFIIS